MATRSAHALEDAHRIHVRVRTLIQEGAEARTVAKVRGALVELAAILPAHFRDEERSLRADPPGPPPRAGRAEPAHDELLEAAWALVRTLPCDSAPLPASVPLFLHHLAEHEQAESALLVDSWGGLDRAMGA